MLSVKFKKYFLWQLSRWNFSYLFLQSNELLELPIYKPTLLPILGKHIDASIDVFDNSWINISVTSVLKLEGAQFRCQCKALKFIYSEKATIFCEIFTVNLSYIVTVKRSRFRKFLWPSQNIWTLK